MTNQTVSPRPARRLLPAALAALCALSALAQPAGASPQRQEADFADLSIEELANIEVTSVSKKPESLLGAPASVFVITADDIRRSGAASLPEALRLAPNLQVAQLNASNWYISARGLGWPANSPPNKLLVLIDGRSVYTPLFSGVFWDAQDVLLEDIERIEVISGPGGTLWGVNAVNGVINITTRSARATEGSLVSLRGAGYGSGAGFRYGARSEGGVSWRAWGKMLQRSHTDQQDGTPADDGWHKSEAGFRADWERGADRVSVNGNAYRGRVGQPAPGTFAAPGIEGALGTIAIDGANLTGRWEHALAAGGSLSLQGWYDHTRRVVPPTFSESLDIADLEFQHSLPPLGAHSVVWGAEYRYDWDNVENSRFVAFLPARVNQSWASLFAQDEVSLPHDLRLTLGARAERNPYTGPQFLPTLRLAWSAAPGHALWAGASRTVRAPSRIDVDAYVPGQPPYLLAGGAQVRSEVAKVVELGYRGQPRADLSYSVTLFHNRYDHLRTDEINASFTQIVFGSLMEGRATGIEMWGSYQASAAWRLSAGMTALHEKLWLKPGSTDSSATLMAARDPAYTAQLRSSWNLDERRELDLSVRHVAALSSPDVPAYTALDARFGWRLRKNVELSVTGQNLNGSHGELGVGQLRSEIPRSIAVKLVWQN